MGTNYEDKLILNGELFVSVRTYLRKKKTSEEIIAKIRELLKEGADINACDGNDNNNTILHIAVEKEEKDVVVYLLQNGANFCCNRNNITPLDIALQKNTALAKEIAEILSEQGKPAATCNDKPKPEQSPQSYSNTSIVSDEEYTYSKRAGTSGVSGQFYETKLLSLVLHRALHDKDIKDFYLAANIKDIGDFDDVCFRYENVACFMQSKHRENTDKAKLTVASVRSSTGKLGLGIYFDSFLKIRQKFSINATDPMFHGKFEDITCYFILYTPLKESFDRKLSGNQQVVKKMHDIIHTSENTNNKNTDIFQFDFENRDLDFLTKFIKYEHMKILGKTFLEFILSNNNKLEAMMASDLIKIYHPALAQNVIFITKALEPPKPQKNSKNSNIQSTSNALSNSNIPNFIHLSWFRPEFLTSEDYYLTILRDTFYEEIVYTHSSKTKLSKEDVKQRIQDIANNPSSDSISQLIGSPIKFDNTCDKLTLDINKLPKNMFTQDEIQQIRFSLQNIQVTKTMVRNAVSLAGKQKLRSLTFQLPQAFGNIDLTTNQKTLEGVHGRLDFLVGKFEKLFNHYAERNRDDQTKVIYIDRDVVGPGKILELSHLSSNGGIGGAVGNLLQFDKQNEYFKFNTNVYGDNAKYVLEKLKLITNDDLDNYKIKIRMDGFPRVSFDVYQYDRNIAADFLSNLWFYTNQAQEESVEATIKKEINIHYNADKQRNQFLFHVHSDAIFLRFHDKVQKWWKRQTDAHYLTKSTTIFEKAKKDIVDSPLLTVLNVMFIRKIKTLGVEFNTNAISNLHLDSFMTKDKNKVLNIVTDAVTLSAAKIMQCSKYRNSCSFINLDYVHILPQNDYKTMTEELQEMVDVTLVITSEIALDQGLQDTLLNILKTFKTCSDISKKQIIIITSKPLCLDREQIFSNYDYITLKDNNVSLLDLTLPSQTTFLDTCKIIYQGQEIRLNTIVDENAKSLLNAKLLWSLLNKDKIEIGRKLERRKYDEIKNYYINRSLKYNGENYVVNTLDDVDDKVVLISSKPCMGKTTLLTHLSLETKKVDPKIWIVRINMSSHVRDLVTIQSDDIKTIMPFLCTAALKKNDDIKNVNFIEIDNETIAVNNDNSQDISFELQLFIHCFNSGNIIFLFDGFDKIYPHNTNEGIKLFTALEQSKKRMWITSDCYVIKILERKFGYSYKLERLSTIQQKSFLESFWTTNLKLEKLNHEQFNNITIFLDYILKTFNRKLAFIDNSSSRPVMPLFSVPLHMIYLTILDYFKNESHSLSPLYFRETLKKKWRLDSYTIADRYFRSCSEDESLQLSGTPLHMYIAANYFVFQITDRFDLHLDTDMIINKSNIYVNAVTLYERFLSANIKNICEIENKTEIGRKQDKLRDDFFHNHKNLVLYAIYKKSDLPRILSTSEINEVEKTIKMIESGEVKTDFIDSVVDGIPRFCHLVFAEYFAVESLSELLKRLIKRDIENLHLNSIWDLIVNMILLVSPDTLRNAFEYKLKYDPEQVEIANNDKYKKIVFDLFLKPSHSRSAIASNPDEAIGVAINEGLANTTDLLLKNIRNHVDEEHRSRAMTVVQSSANILTAVNPSQTILNDNMLKCIESVSGETIIGVLNSSEMGAEIHSIVTDKVAEPLKKLTEKVIDFSGNENVVKLVEELPHYLPDFVRTIFNKK